MKYLLIIATIIAAIIGLSFSYLWVSKPPLTHDILVKVNNSPITNGTLNALQDTDCIPKIASKKSAIENLITRELLIQEAQKLEIDQNGKFQTSLKQFYEQSLINTLIEQKTNSIKAPVDESDIDQYISLLGSTVTFSLFGYNNDTSQDNSPGNTRVARFDDLDENMRATLTPLEPSQTIIQYDDENGQYLLRLDSVLNKNKTIISSPEKREIINNILSAHSRKRQIYEWLSGLRQNASITIYAAKEQE